ncbi:hypothetical protein GP475_03925 [Corynebacterium poyangense]|uniref:Uncharacterized protein n=1 Tax=Corynebacterium poyangense TaxID=2684405 RepID=A0A7H0SMW3_9CORY|nr:hypothetical protein [Corynebacterium poyangense]QNQ89888.1 hypothetical protein GP475_03925 [Corynebacterium poyangense]
MSTGDTAAMESFSLHCNLGVLNTKRWASGEELGIAVITWVERCDHHRR